MQASTLVRRGYSRGGRVGLDEAERGEVREITRIAGGGEVGAGGEALVSEGGTIAAVGDCCTEGRRRRGGKRRRLLRDGNGEHVDEDEAGPRAEGTWAGFVSWRCMQAGDWPYLAGRSAP